MDFARNWRMKYRFQNVRYTAKRMSSKTNDRNILVPLLNSHLHCRPLPGPLIADLRWTVLARHLYQTQTNCNRPNWDRRPEATTNGLLGQHKATKAIEELSNGEVVAVISIWRCIEMCQHGIKQKIRTEAGHLVQPRQIGSPNLGQKRALKVRNASKVVHWRDEPKGPLFPVYPTAWAERGLPEPDLRGQRRPWGDFRKYVFYASKQEFWNIRECLNAAPSKTCYGWPMEFGPASLLFISLHIQFTFVADWAVIVNMLHRYSVGLQRPGEAASYWKFRSFLFEKFSYLRHPFPSCFMWAGPWSASGLIKIVRVKRKQ